MGRACAHRPYVFELFYVAHYNAHHHRRYQPRVRDAHKLVFEFGVEGVNHGNIVFFAVFYKIAADGKRRMRVQKHGIAFIEQLFQLPVGRGHRIAETDERHPERTVVKNARAIFALALFVERVAVRRRYYLAVVLPL